MAWANQQQCEFKKIRSIKPFQVQSEWLTHSVWIEQRQTFLIPDLSKRCIIEIDLNGNLIGSHNPESILSSPSCLCINWKNEIFVFDNCKLRVLAFNTEIEHIRTFGDSRLTMCTDMAADVDSDLIFVLQYFQNLVSIWNSASGEFVNEFAVASPCFIKVKDNLLFILSAIDTEIFTEVVEAKEKVNTNNMIYVYDKHNLAIFNKIPIAYCVNPKGLYVDDSLNVYLAAHDQNARRENAKHLFKIKPNGECVQKTNLRVSFVFHMSFLKNKILIVRAYIEPTVVLLEFD